MIKLKDGLWFLFNGRDLYVRKGLHSPEVDALWSRYQERDIVDENDVDEKRNFSMPFKSGCWNWVHARRHVHVGSSDLLYLRETRFVP